LVNTQTLLAPCDGADWQKILMDITLINQTLKLIISIAKYGWQYNLKPVEKIQLNAVNSNTGPSALGSLITPAKTWLSTPYPFSREWCHLMGFTDPFKKCSRISFLKCLTQWRILLKNAVVIERMLPRETLFMWEIMLITQSSGQLNVCWKSRWFIRRKLYV